MVNEVKIEKTKDFNAFLIILKGSLIAVSVSLILILIFAFAIKYIAIPTEAIRPINQIIKVISIFFGVFLAMKKVEKMGLINGLLIGVFYTIIAFLVFSILDGKFEFNRTILNDILFGGISGAVCGVISANLLNK